VEARTITPTVNALRAFLDAHARESAYRATCLTVDGYENGGEFDMEMTSARAEARWRPRRIIVVGAVGGMLSGMMMGATEMFYGWASPAHTFWDPLMAIWAWVGGRNHFGTPSSHVGPIILGLGGHMMNAMAFGIVFALVATAFATLLRRRGASWAAVDSMAIMLGVGWGLLAWVVMRYGILPLRADAEANLFTKAVVSPQWTWWLAHAVLGMTAGVVFVAARRIGEQPVGVAQRRDELRTAA